MPELPEVEIVKEGLKRLGSLGSPIVRVHLLRSSLRTPLKKELKTRLPGQSFLQIRRRAKYILFETENYTLLSHLGMTGSWRKDGPTFEPEKHDHVVIELENKLKLVFNDPRRFGVLELFAKNRLTTNRWLSHLGPEPLEEQFTAEYLFERTRRRKGPIKNFIMDQRQVVGVGNIYASEALFSAGVKPTRQAGKLTRVEAEKLVASVQRILRKAIAAGGSTIRDYRNSEGKLGEFQAQFAVYDRSSKPCTVCGQAIRSRFLGGRNTFWCGKCQR